MATQPAASSAQRSKEEPSSPSQPPKHTGPKEFMVRVYRLNEEKENADFPIAINVIGHKRRVITPGKEEKLLDYHIEVLRNAVNETVIEIPQESGIYEAANPVAVAESNYPGFKASVDQEDGSITITKRQPRFSVEVIKEL